MRFLERGALNESPALPYSDLSPKQLDHLVMQCRLALHSHHREIQRQSGERAEEFLAAKESARRTLLDLLEVAPSEKRAKIEAILQRY